ncbi:MAG: DUF4405 domain-containing protein [Melioribacter sp.]|nr:DUF4405 domain-containing protein [Melioribacter sp.]
MKKKFSWRGFISLYITLSFIIMAISGIILYFSPPGRVANWSYWRFLGLLKSQWQAIHTIFTFLFIVAAGFHLFFNWKPFIAYLKTKFESNVKLRNEFTISSIVVILIFAMTIYDFVPFKNVMDFGEELKASWSTEKTEPPIPHAEDLTLTEFAKTINVSVEEIKNSLSSKGIIIQDENITIKELASKNNISPNEIYTKLRSGNKQQNQVAGEGRGYGRKTLAEISAENNLNIDKVITNLKSHGIDAVANDKLKDIAMRNNLLPVDVANKALGIKSTSE